MSSPLRKACCMCLVAGDVGEDAQLDLAVIGIHQHTAGLCDEVGPQLAAQLGADGDVLQVGVVGGETPGAGFGLVEAWCGCGHPAAMTFSSPST